MAGALAFTALAPVPAAAAPGGAPDFGPNVRIFDESTPLEEINAYLMSISDAAEFSTDRHAVFFEPGTYGSAAGQDDPSTATGIVNSEVGYYTSIQGLGASPEDVVINGALHVEPVQEADTGPSNSLTRFWRSLGNLTINPIQRPVGPDADRPRPEGIAEPHTMRWAVSQAAPLRRVNIEGNLDLTGRYGATAFGTYIANSRIEGTVTSGDARVEYAQAQWYTRDSEIGGWDGAGINYVFSGVRGAPQTDFGARGTTTLPSTPISREAPFLYLDGDEYEVFVPSAKPETSGTHWGTGQGDGVSIPIDRFFIAKPGNSAATINAALAAGKHLLLTPGVYSLDAPIRVTRADTVVMGMGYASLAPAAGTAAIEVGDVPGVVVSSLTVDSGPATDVLIRVGTRGGHSGIVVNPTTLTDVFVRVGGARPGQATTSVEVNSNHVILDHTWLWRADHGAGAGWESNLADHGLVVNGDDVTALGLFVEHYQEEQVIWNGERGRTVFFQSEMPYDPPNQAAWMNGTAEGYAAYVVGDHVKKHEATGMAIYSLFLAGFGPYGPLSGPQVHASSAIEGPVPANVRFRSMATGVIAAGGGIRHVVNDAGAAVDAAAPNDAVHGMTAVTRLASYPARW
ncbi:hypothetical protein [Blastococcus montanus]|uniref:hypothetical protein n=1 Tax=Blastococcus montanus TaxID=3144973 RepID=UPI0032090DBF